ncbi:PREDICTED: gustatory and pheromone receptor 32a-like [Rhagoletis zephyria]|uniref:gustatory and pheromone receptor 32a-like n=1 Tax=Rhagoletis zephyria TaxID=28612 RepID=UPI000811815E|nr:PREDICTED: gustatory and pheromone receptor 32a-like [Rhagoletis zephyria]
MQNRNRVNSAINIIINKPKLVIHPLLTYLKWHLLILKTIGVIPFYTKVNLYEIGMPNRHWLLISKGIISIKIALNLLHLYSLLSPTILQMLFVRSNTDGITNVLDVAFCMLSDVIISWSCARNATAIIAIINGFLKVDKLLTQYPESPAQQSYSGNLYNTYLLLTFGYIFTLMLAFVKRSLDAFSIYYCIYISFYQLENASSCAFTILISSLMHLLRERFQYVNHMLSQYTSSSQVLQNAERPVFISDRSDEKLRLFVENSKFIYGLHNDLLDIFKLINSYADLGLLAFLLYACYGLLSCAYNFALYDWRNNEDFYYVIWTLSWIPLYAGILMLLSNNCDVTTKEANRTTQVLARIYGKGEKYQSTIDKFLTKSVKQEVSFTAYGFFVINNRTLFKIFTTVNTYLVMLIQFKQLEESKNR